MTVLRVAPALGVTLCDTGGVITLSTAEGLRPGPVETVRVSGNRGGGGGRRAHYALSDPFKAYVWGRSRPSLRPVPTDPGA